MRQVVISRHGAPEVLKLIDAPVPQPGPGEVRIRVRTAGVAAADRLMRRGAYPGAPKPPFAPGYDVVGTVDAVGSGSGSTFAIGARVGAFTEVGGYGEFVCAPADGLIVIPDNVSDVEGVASILNYGTAYQLLHRAAEARSGETILVPGAGGGVGTALLQLAQIAGVRALGAASAKKHALVRELGGEPIDYKREDVAKRAYALTGGKGVDVALDQTGGGHLWLTRSALRPGGRMTIFGFAGAVGPDGRPRKAAILQSILIFALMKLMPSKKVGLYVSNDEFKKRRARFVEEVETVLGMISSGRIRPIIEKVLPLEKAAEAHRLLENGDARGKIVLQIAEANR